MDCCCQKISSEETAHPFHSLYQSDHLTITAPTKTDKSIPIPKLNVSLDLPGFTDYLPTYWPGQTITGEIEIEPLSPIKVSSLRIILFGQVQVHGEHPGKPLTNGMFDYAKNVQIISKGLQVIRRSQPFCNNSNNNNSNNNDRPTGDPNKKRLKTAEDRQIEKLVKEITTFCDSTGIRIDSPHHNKSSSKTEFELNASKHRIRFSMDAPEKLPSSFEHPHFPISYSIVVLMSCRAPEDACFTLHATAKLRLERFLNVDIAEHTLSIQTPYSYRYIPKSNGLMSNLFSSSLHLIKISLPSNNLKPKSRITSLEQDKHAPGYDSFLNVYLELSRQAYEPSQQVPLQLKLVNNTTSFRICTIKTEIRLVRRINMHCNLGEEVEATVLDSAQLVSQNMPQQSNLNFSKLIFDLSEICKIPEDASNSISSAATKDVFSMSYNYHAAVYITGEITDNITLDSQEKTFSIQQRDVQRLSSLRKLNCCSENHTHKTYFFELDPLVITVGRYANGTI
ncbi:hypothetical protein K501DRAFT_305533 [Backusella circina FSU 941]|nr:hypothetical protein K501DRAFT_305533 [Backusella circina FSU 941]